MHELCYHPTQPPQEGSNDTFEFNSLCWSMRKQLECCSGKCSSSQTERGCNYKCMDQATVPWTQWVRPLSQGVQTYKLSLQQANMRFVSRPVLIEPRCAMLSYSGGSTHKRDWRQITARRCRVHRTKECTACCCNIIIHFDSLQLHIEGSLAPQKVSLQSRLSETADPVEPTSRRSDRKGIWPNGGARRRRRHSCGSGRAELRCRSPCSRSPGGTAASATPPLIGCAAS